MRRLITLDLLLRHASYSLPVMSFAQVSNVFYGNLKKNWQIGKSQKNGLSAALISEKLSLLFLPSDSITIGIVPKKKYGSSNFNFQAIIEACLKNACLIISEKLVQPIKLYALNSVNHLIAKPDPAGEK